MFSTRLRNNSRLRKSLSSVWARSAISRPSAAFALSSSAVRSCTLRSSSSFSILISAIASFLPVTSRMAAIIMMSPSPSPGLRLISIGNSEASFRRPYNSRPDPIGRRRDCAAYVERSSEGLARKRSGRRTSNSRSRSSFLGYPNSRSVCELARLISPSRFTMTIASGADSSSSWVLARTRSSSPSCAPCINSAALLFIDKDKPFPVHRVDELLRESLVHGLPEVAHVDVDNVGAGVELVSPHLLDEPLAGENLVLVSEQKFEERKFLVAQRNPLSGALDGPLHHVHREVCRLQNRCAGKTGAAEHRLDAGEKLAGGERLHAIVVRPELEPLDAVFNAVHGGEDEDRRGVGGAAEVAQNVQAGLLRQVEIENDDMVLTLAGFLLGSEAVSGDVAAVAGPFKLLLYRSG